MPLVYELNDYPVAVDLGRLGRATVLSSRPFVTCDGIQRCANYPHKLDSGHRQEVFLQALGERRPGLLKVWER